MELVFLVTVALVLLFGFVVLFGAPYLPTLKPQVTEALSMLDLAKGDTLLELGSGDGRVMLAAAKRGYNVVGIELNPILCLVSYFVTWRYRKQVRVIWGNFWRVAWPESDAIFVFLLDKYMPELDKKIMQYNRKQVKVLSYAFEIPGKVAIKRKNALFLYDYTKTAKGDSI